MPSPVRSEEKQAVPEPDAFEARPSVALGAETALKSAGVGLLVSAVQNSMEKHNKGAMGVLTRTGGTIAFFAAMGGIFSFTESAVANFREKNDALNGAAGGCAAGLLAGARARSFPIMLASCAAVGTLVGTFDAAGKSLVGSHTNPDVIAHAQQHGEASEGHAGEGRRHGREEREARRAKFFKNGKPLTEQVSLSEE